MNEAATARRKIAISTISLAEVAEHVFTEAVLTAAIVQSMRKVSRAEVPDMPDRIVAATAVYFDVPVISRERRIRAAGLKTLC